MATVELLSRLARNPLLPEHNFSWGAAMPLASAVMYAIGLILAFGGTSATIGLMTGFDELAIVLVLHSYLAVTIWLLIRWRSFGGENAARVRKALLITIVMRILLSFFPCAAIDVYTGFFSVKLWGGDVGVMVDGRRCDFLPTLPIGLLQGVAGFIQFLLMYGVLYCFCGQRTENPDRCRKCGYDIRASREFGRCPECGTPIARC